MDDSKVTQEKETSSSNDTSIILNLENLIKNHVSSSDKLRVELKKHKEMIADHFENDATYKLHNERVKEATKLRQQTKTQIMNIPGVKEIAEKIKGMNQDLKESQDALSDYLKEYARLTGTNEIEGEDGEVREIVYTAKLVRKQNR